MIPQREGCFAMLLKKLPNIHLTSIDGSSFSTDQLLGKKTLIFMWASW